MMPTSAVRGTRAPHRLPLGWEVAIDVAAALGLWALTFFNQFPVAVVYTVPIAFLLIAIPQAVRRRKGAATSTGSTR